VNRERLMGWLYAGATIAAIAMLISVAVLRRPEVPIRDVLLAALAPSILLAAIGLAARFPCRAMPLRRTPVSRLVVTHVASAAAAASVWALVWRPTAFAIRPDAPLLFGAGVVIYLGTVVVHYLAAEIDVSREAEATALRYQVLAREAELRAFKAQIDPHFLFNSLNAVASLCGSRPLDAREMAQLMADFFRMTLRVAKRDRITMAEEIDLVSRYLGIEKVRFGSRLETNIVVDDGAASCLVPPLLLQPLVENAVRHGIASLVEGGTVDIAATTNDGLLHIRIDNPADPDRPQPQGESIGLQNARGRLAAISEGRAQLRTTEDEGRYVVNIRMPAVVLSREDGEGSRAAQEILRSAQDDSGRLR